MSPSPTQARPRTRQRTSPSSRTSTAAPYPLLYPLACVPLPVPFPRRAPHGLTAALLASLAPTRPQLQVRFLSGPAYSGTSAFPSLAAAAGGDASFSLSAIAPVTQRDQLVAAALLASLRDDADDGGEGVDGRGAVRREMEEKVAAVGELRERLKEERERSRRRGAAVRVDV